MEPIASDHAGSAAVAEPGGRTPLTPPAPTNAYVGPQPIPWNRRIYGRDRELLVLANRLLSDRLVLMYSPSGAGKTSLIMAKGGIGDRMQDEQFTRLPVVRVSHAADVAARHGVNRYLLSTLVALELALPEGARRDAEQVAQLVRRFFRTPRDANGDARDAHAGGTQEAMTPDDWLPADFLHSHLAQLLRAMAKPSDQLFLVFDQFEELLTLDPTDDAAKRTFLHQVGTALRQTECWALFAMREDHVAALEPYLPLLPTRLAATFRLDLLGKEAAVQAAILPAAEPEFAVTFATEAAQALVNELAQTRVQDPLTGESLPRQGLHVEPLHLQVVCQQLWEHRATPDCITPDDLNRLCHTASAELHGVTAALAAYYDETVRATAEHFAALGSAERKIRAWFERFAISSPAGLRLPVLLGTEAQCGLTPAVLTALEDRYVIRAERRHGAIYYEVAHDRLVDPIRKSNNAWRTQNLNSFQLAAETWARKPSDDLLVLGEALEEGQRLTRDHAAAMTDDEKAFLDASLAQRHAIEERERQQRELQEQREKQQQQALEHERAIRRERDVRRRMERFVLVLALICVVLVLGGLAIFFWYQHWTAQRVFTERQKADLLVFEAKQNAAKDLFDEKQRAADKSTADATLNNARLFALLSLSDNQFQYFFGQSAGKSFRDYDFQPLIGWDKPPPDVHTLTNLGLDPNEGYPVQLGAIKALDKLANTATSEALLTGIIEALKLLSAKAEATVRGDAARTKTNTQALRNAAQQAAESAELRPPLLRGTKILFQFSPLMQFGLSGVEAKQGKHSLKRLTYAPNGTTNRTSIVVNGKEVIFGSDAGWWSDRGKQEMLPTRPDRKDRLGIQSEWIYKNGDVALRVRQVLEILRDDQRELNTCVIGYVIDNDGDGRLSVGLQAELDTKIDTNDHNPFAASDKQTGKESLITAARMFNSPELPPYVKALQKASLEDPGYLGYFSLLLNAASDGLTPPTSFLIANLYQLPPATSPIKLPQPAPKLDDSAVAIRWDPPPLPKGGRRTMVYAFGLGKLTLAEAASQNAWILELANERKDSPK